MDVRNCRTCGTMFNYLSGPILCETCRAELEEKFQEVKEYVRENPNALINVVSKKCEVSVKQINQWIREERLILSEDSDIFIECESCGAPIRMGKYCEKCKAKIHNDLRKAYARPEPRRPEPTRKRDSGRDRMRFLDL